MRLDMLLWSHTNRIPVLRSSYMKFRIIYSRKSIIVSNTWLFFKFWIWNINHLMFCHDHQKNSWILWFRIYKRQSHLIVKIYFIMRTKYNSNNLFTWTSIGTGSKINRIEKKLRIFSKYSSIIQSSNSKNFLEP